MFSIIITAILAQDVPKEAVGPTLMRPDLAVKVALQDVLALEAEDPISPLFTRYVMVNQPNDMTLVAMGYMSNMAFNFGGETFRPVAVKALVPGVYRLNMKKYSGSDKLKDERLPISLGVFDRIEDKQFYLTSDELVSVRHPKWLFRKGKPVGHKSEFIKIRKKIPFGMANADGDLDELQKVTQSEVPIVSEGQLFYHALERLYHEFRQYDLAPEGSTAEREFLLRSGTDLDDLGDRNADQRVVQVRTPTANYGFIEFVNSSGGKASLGRTITTITRDFFEGAIRNNKHPIENLPDRKHDGSEIIAFKADGGIEVLLTDGKGNAVREAPQKLASDRRVPAPFLPNLRSIASCIRCHQDGAFFLDTINYVTLMREATVDGKKFDVFADLSDDDLQRLVSLFSGTTDDAFADARRTHAKFCQVATGFTGNEGDEKLAIAENVMGATIKVFDDWIYRYHTPQDLCRMLGYDTDSPEEGRQLFNRIVPPRLGEPLRISSIRVYNSELQVPKLTIFDLLEIFPEVSEQCVELERSRAQQP